MFAGYLIPAWVNWAIFSDWRLALASICCLYLVSICVNWTVFSDCQLESSCWERWDGRRGKASALEWKRRKRKRRKRKVGGLEGEEIAWQGWWWWGGGGVLPLTEKEIKRRKNYFSIWHENIWWFYPSDGVRKLVIVSRVKVYDCSVWSSVKTVSVSCMKVCIKKQKQILFDAVWKHSVSAVWWLECGNILSV